MVIPGSSAAGCSVCSEGFRKYRHCPEKAPDEAVPEKVLPKKIVLKNRRNKPKVRVVVKTENVEKINKESGRKPLINYMLSFWDYEYICYHE